MPAKFINCKRCQDQGEPRTDGSCPNCGSATLVAITVDKWMDFPDVCADCGGVGRRRLEVVAVRDKDGPIDAKEFEKRSLRGLLTRGLIPLLFDASQRREQIVKVELPVCEDCYRQSEFPAQFTDFPRGTVGVLVHANLKAALSALDQGRGSG